MRPNAGPRAASRWAAASERPASSAAGTVRVDQAAGPAPQRRRRWPRSGRAAGPARHRRAAAAAQAPRPGAGRDQGTKRASRCIRLALAFSLVKWRWRWDLNPRTGEISPITDMNPKTSEKSPDWGSHAAMVTGAARLVSSGDTGTAGTRAASGAPSSGGRLPCYGVRSGRSLPSSGSFPLGRDLRRPNFAPRATSTAGAARPASTSACLPTGASAVLALSRRCSPWRSSQSAALPAGCHGWWRLGWDVTRNIRLIEIGAASAMRRSPS